MEVKITYFYHVRNLDPSEVPVSTAVYDPKWYHDFKNNSHIFVDKRGVVNGIRCIALQPRILSDGECKGPKECSLSPSECSFMKNYRNQLEGIDFKSLMQSFEEIPVKLNRNVESVVLLVHEKPYNPCSERMVLVDWFRENGVKLEERFR